MTATTVPGHADTVRSARRPLLWIAVVVLVACAGGLVAYRGEYGMYPWRTYPRLLHTCGDRDYQQTGPIVRRSAITEHITPLDVIPTFTGHETIWSTRRDDGCGSVWLQGSDDAFMPYSLIGGV